MHPWYIIDNYVSWPYIIIKPCLLKYITLHTALTFYTILRVLQSYNLCCNTLHGYVLRVIWQHHYGQWAVEIPVDTPVPLPISITSLPSIWTCQSWPSDSQCTCWARRFQTLVASSLPWPSWRAGTDHGACSGALGCVKLTLLSLRPLSCLNEVTTSLSLEPLVDFLSVVRPCCCASSRGSEHYLEKPHISN